MDSVLAQGEVGYRIIARLPASAGGGFGSPAFPLSSAGLRRMMVAISVSF
jgi:hypothetical protein